MPTKSIEKTRQYYLALIKTEPFQKAVADFKVRWGFDKDITKRKDYGNIYEDAKKTFIEFGLGKNFCSVLIADHIHKGTPLEDLEIPNLLCIVDDNLGPYDADKYGSFSFENGEEDFPIVLKISPYATKRDILETEKVSGTF